MPLFQSRRKGYIHWWKASRQLDEKRIQFRIYYWYFGFSISDGKRSIPYFWRVFHFGNQFYSKWLTGCNIMCSCIGKEGWTINLSRTWTFSKLLLLKSNRWQELNLDSRHFQSVVYWKPWKNGVSTFLLILFLIFVNILLLNMIIALFTSTYDEIKARDQGTIISVEWLESTNLKILLALVHFFGPWISD